MAAHSKGRRRGSHTRRSHPLLRALHLFERLVMVWVVLAAIVLGAVIVGPRFLPYEALVVRSGSMSPTIPTGSIVFYRHEAASQVKVGQIILFGEPGDPDVKVTHRVHAIVDSASGEYFVTKGDANAVPDAWRISATGVGWVVAFHVPYVGYPFAFLATGLARMLLLTIPAVALGLLLLAEQLRPRRRAHRSVASG